MTLKTTSTGVSGIVPGDYAELIVKPVQETSTAFDERVSTRITTGSKDVHIPIQTGDGGAAFVAEGDEIDIDDATFREMTATPRKVAGIRVISRELADDSSPEAQELVGRSLTRAIAKEIDRAFFGNLNAPAPKGLASLTAMSTVAAGTAFTNLDPFAEAVSKAQLEDAELSAFLISPADALVVAQLKAATNSNAPLLQPDATQSTNLRVQGVPLIVTKNLTKGTVWGIDRDSIYSVMREDVRLDVSQDAYFTSDRVGLRATCRVDFAFVNPAALVKITTTAP